MCDLCPSPFALKYAMAVLIAVSTADDPHIVKKILLRSPGVC